MATYDYQKKRALAEKQISKYGESIPFYQETSTDGGFDNRGRPIPPTQSRVEYNGIVTPILKLSDSLIDGENFKRGDGYVYFHNYAAKKPPINSLIDINGKTYTLISYMKDLTSLDGVNVLLQIQLRYGI